MKVFPIEDPVAGEQVLAVEPKIERYPDAEWRQRLNYFTGRALTHSALILEQTGRAGHLSTLGRALSPGVVSGLEAVAAQTSEGAVIDIAPGMGLAASGEVITLNRNQQVLLDDIRVYAPAAILEPGSAGTNTSAYKLGGTLGELRSQGSALPREMILVLQPVAVEYFSQPDSSDPCDYDPSDEAFEDWQWLDGFRMVLYASSLISHPPPNSIIKEFGLRNRAANAIFQQERILAEGEYLPWWEVGVPIALIGLNSSLRYSFLDRNSVVRRGGEAKGGGVPISPLGNRFLWQARFEQFNEQLVDWLTSISSLDPAQMTAFPEFQHLPPVGVLPKEAMNPRQQLQHFFPPAYAVRAMAVPYEQLDLAIEESASLLPYDLFTPDRVEVLVPVPQEHYEPQLLVVEVIDPVFDQTIARFTSVRDQWLGRRLVVRSKASALYKAIKGTPLLYPADDPNAIDSLEQAIDFEQQLVKQGDSCAYRKGISAPPINWFQNSYDDSKWSTGPTSIGYGAEGLGTALDDMKGLYFTFCLRHRFHLDSVADTHRYSIVVTTNGGFYAYLNGKYLTAANVTRPVFNFPAQHAQTLQPRRYELGELSGRLLVGENLLAIQAHNVSVNESLFSISIELLDTEDSFGTEEAPVLRNTTMSIPFGQEQYEVTALDELRTYLDTTTPLSDAEVDKLDGLGVEEFIEFLQQKINQADDKVEFGFLRLRTDIYRVRQMMLGNEAGTKLATSPALAEIAKGDSAVATKEELSTFYQRIKNTQSTGADSGTIRSESSVSGLSTTPMSRTSSQANLFLSGDLAMNDMGKTTVTKGGSASTTGGIKILDTIIGDRGEALNLSTELQSQNSTAGLFNFASGVRAQDISQQNPVVGMVQSFNNATVGARLEESSANIAHMAGVAVKGELIGNLLETDIHIDDLMVPGIKVEGKPLSFADIRGNEAILNDILAGVHDPVGGDDEAAYFSASVKALENVVGILRLIEGRVHAYRRAIERCKSTVNELQSQLSKCDARLKTIGNELAEARHDVSVAQALKTEEVARIAALNGKRDRILQTLVPFLVFRRPRTLDPRQDAPLHFINPNLSDQPLPLCDLSEVETPEALEAMLDVVRDAPMKWFAAVNLILPHLSRLEDLHVTLSGAKKRASSKITMHPFISTNFNVPDKLLQGLGMAVSKTQQRILLERRKTVALDLSLFQRLGWQESIQRVPEVVSLGDLIDGNHGRMGASQRAAAEMAMISKVATCLYVNFSAISAGIRLDWAERLSQYDAPVNLRNLYSLPRFGEIEYIERHNMQRLVDWLYGRINGKYSDATDMISDLIRVALLVASHAPVNQLIAGHLPAPVMVRPGSFVNVIADLSRVRIGMAVSIASAGATLVRGKVVDISGGELVAEVHTTVGESVALDSGARVQIGERLGMMFSEF